MTIRYSLRRGDVWSAYWIMWRRRWPLKLSQLFIASCAFFVSLSWLAPHRTATPGEVVRALGVALLSILWLPLYPLLRFKPQERTLTIGPAGIATSIGKLSKELPWSAVGGLESEENRFYIVAKTGNMFIVPSEAFASQGDRAEFERSTRQWWLDRRDA